jgi:hypothetical protein
LSDRGLDHLPPNIRVAHCSHGMVWLSHGVEHRKRLIDMLRPDAIDFFAGRRIAPLRVAAEGGARKHSGYTFNQRSI